MVSTKKMSNFGTKAETLRQLKGRLRLAKIPSIFTCTLAEWKNSKNQVMHNVLNQLDNEHLIVRSSCTKEDCTEQSNAGAFLSVPNVSIDELSDAIDKVFVSYKSYKDTEQVLIQPMLKNVIMSGVVFSHDPNTCAPDRLISWSEGEDTSLVTGGIEGKILQIADCAKLSKNNEFYPLIKMIDELLLVFNGIPLDCEFAITGEKSGKTLWLLQVRPLILKFKPVSSESHSKRLKLIRNKISSGMKPVPFLKGNRTIYAVMPDWNPAEIIGVRPRPLALSLYQELITDSIWAYQRHNYGYRNLRSHPLMPNFLGLPYIDVRVSFNSFIPADLNEDLATGLVEYYIEKLISQPKSHDKVEFDIVWSCYTFDLDKRLSVLKNNGFSNNDQAMISDSLRDLTNNILHPQKGLWGKDAEKLKTLDTRYRLLQKSQLDPLSKIYWLLEDAKRYGTLPFAGLARASFIAVQMLKSLVSLKIFSHKDYEDFMASISTISSQMITDRQKLNKSDFLNRYGHLRPGTYDILSERYDSNPDLYFNWNIAPKNLPNKDIFIPQDSQIELINDELIANSLNCDADGLLNFMRSTIALREQAKFDFTRNLSDALSLIERIGHENNLTVEDLSYADIGVFRDLYVSAKEPRTTLLESIKKGRASYKETLKLSLPPIITKTDDLYNFKWPETDPNFVTQGTIIGPVAESKNRDQISGSIVCITNADPGYDWIFSYPIVGFITAWGGVNSHMAIRAAEQGVAAVIGAGEVLYRRWSSAKQLKIDCAGRRVEVIV